MSFNPNIHISENPFVTESGFAFENPRFAYQTWGKPNSAKDNAVVIFHALTGNSNAEEWFSGFFAPNSPINNNEHYIICVNHLGSCYGSTGPQSINPKNGKPYKSEFPIITIRDMARFQQHFLDELGIKGIELVIGGSMGGMVALEFTLLDTRVKHACYIAMGKNHSPWAIGISEAQRLAIYGDANWNNGNYEVTNGPINGLKSARAMAMITYRSPQNYEHKFKREKQAGKNIFQVESYLNYQGDKLVNRFDALSYVRLTQAMDTHDVNRARGTEQDVLSKISIPTLVIGISSDILYPIEEQVELAEKIPNAKLVEINSDFGHDAFLIEFDIINKSLTKFLKEKNLNKAV